MQFLLNIEKWGHVQPATKESDFFIFKDDVKDWLDVMNVDYRPITFGRVTVLIEIPNPEHATLFKLAWL